MTSTIKNLKNLNDSLVNFSVTKNYYKTHLGFVYTDGIKALCENFETTSWWILDIIMSYQPQLFKEEFQRWSVIKNVDGSATVTCEEGDYKELIRKEIQFSDISGNCTVILENGILHLPNEE